VVLQVVLYELPRIGTNWHDEALTASSVFFDLVAVRPTMPSDRHSESPTAARGSNLATNGNVVRRARNRGHLSAVASGARLSIEVRFHEGWKHLPIVIVRRAA
jgi:hypothetical protein